MQGGYGGGYGGGAPPGGGGYGQPPGGAPPGGGYGQPPGGAPPGGGYGQPPGGAPPGGYGQPPGGAPPGGGFGQPPGMPPPGGGYGAPPGGGFAPPPQGGNPGGFNPYGAPGAGPPQTGAGRFIKHAVIGGAIAGVVSMIPFLNCLNLCFCLLVQGGAIVGVHMYLRENPQEQLSNGDAATAGAMAGVVSGVISGVLQMIVNLVFGGGVSGLGQVLRQLPPDVARNLAPLMAGGGIGFAILSLILGIVIQAAFGALGGVLAMSLFFKDRKRA